MKVEFWNSLLTEKSWKILQELRKTHNFILIGGWAIYLLTKQQKSKDIDILVSISELEKLKSENLKKNDRLKKYEIKKEEIDIDIYLEHYSILPIPSENIKEYTTSIEGFIVPRQEALLILKQKAYSQRMYSVKGEKDKIDILSLLLFTEIDFSFYGKILTKYKLPSYKTELISLLKQWTNYEQLGLTPQTAKKKKTAIIKALS